MRTCYKYSKKKFNSIINWTSTPFKNGLTWKPTIEEKTQMKLKGIKIEDVRKKAQDLEKQWGNNIINSFDNINWSSEIGENIVHDVLLKNGEHPFKPKKVSCYNLDWETDKYIYEVKTSSWTIPGTAGEKVLGTMYKYSDIPFIYNKPLRIICIAYQEWELTYGNTKIFCNEISKNKKKFIRLAKDMNIEYVKFSDLI